MGKFKVFSKKLNKVDPRKDLTDEYVKKVFEGQNDIEAQYIHSGYWEAEKKEPITIGKWHSFEVKDGEAYAELELNEKGKSYGLDGIFKGISAEIEKVSEKLLKICVLPLGVTPACEGTQVYELASIENYIEYEVMGGTEKMNPTVEEILLSISGMTINDKIKVLSAIGSSVTNEEKKGLRTLVYSEYEVQETEAEKAHKAELLAKDAKIAEYEVKERVSLVKEVLSQHKDKLIGNMSRIAEYALLKATEETEVLEFEAGKEKVTRFEQFKTDIAGMKDFKYLTEEFQMSKNVEEKTKNEIEKTEDLIKGTMDSVKKRQGGK